MTATAVDYHSKEYLAQRVTESLDRAERYIGKGWVIVKTHAPLFSTSGRVGCTCEHYKRSEAYRQWLADRDREREYNPSYTCPNPGKHPYGNWKDITEVMSHKKAVAIWGKPSKAIDVDTGETVRVVWNIGVLTGPSNILTLDADTYKSHYRCDLADLIPLDDQETPQQFTHSGGLHLVFDREGKHYSNANGELKAAGIEGVDIRGESGFQVVEPSLGPSGNEYAWLEGYEPWTIAPHPIPTELDRLLSTAAGKRSAPANPVEFTAVTTVKPDLAQWGLHPKILHLLHNPLPKGQRSEADQKVITALIHHGATDDAILAFFEHYPIGTKGRFAEKGRDYLARSIGKARVYVENHSFDTNNDSSGVDALAAENAYRPTVNLNGAVYTNGHSSATATQDITLPAGTKVIWRADSGDLPATIAEYLGQHTDGEDYYRIDVDVTDIDGQPFNGNGGQPKSKLTVVSSQPATVPSTVALVADLVLTVDEVLQAISEIATQQSTELDADPTQAKEKATALRKARVVKELGFTIGELERTDHALIIDALEKADAGFTRTDAKDFVRGCMADAKKRHKAAQRARAEQARQNLLAVRASKNKVSIEVGGQQLSDIADEALRVLIANNAGNPTLFVRGGALVRIVQDERGQYGIQEFSNGAMMGKLAEVADWETVGIDINGIPHAKATFPPRDVVATLLCAGEWPGLPALTGVVTAPVFSPDGVLHDQPGYNPATRLYYTGGVTLGDTTPTAANIARAKELILNNLLVDFPFKDAASKAHAVAYLLLPFVRDLIDGPTPVHVGDSPTAGTGKGKLLNACAYPSIGHDVPTMAAAKEDDEWRKRLTSLFLNGNTHAIIDNVNHELDSGSLASAFTQPVWEDRTLGTNRQVKIPIRTIWGITANNIKMSQELARRCVWLRLDANVEKPWERTGFKHENLIGWAKVNRGPLLTAALTFVRAWLEKGKPLYTGRTKGSYEEWASVMGGILEVIGIPGFLENETELYDRVVSKNDLLVDFVKAWWEKQQELEGKRQAEILASGESKTEICLSSYELFKLASYADDEEKAKALGESWHNLLGDMLNSQKQKGRQTQLGKILDTHIEKVVAGYKIILAKTANGSKFWRLQPTLVEPQTEVLPGSTEVLPPVNDVSDEVLVEPVEPNHTGERVAREKISRLVNGASNRQEKNNISYIALGVAGSTGSTEVGQNGSSTGGSGLVEPQPGSTEVLPEIEVVTWEL